MNQKLSVKEIISYALGNSGFIVIYMIFSGYLTMYYTDSVGINAAAIGTLMLVARIFDGISDLTAGYLIDRTKTRWGKARPWIIGSAPILAVMLVLTFAVPQSFSATGKLIYACITYIFLTAIVYTICNLAFITLLALMTTDANSRTKAATVGSFIGPAAVLVISFIAMKIVTAIGWTGMAMIFAAVGLIFIIICFWGTREKTNIAVSNESIIADKVPAKTSLKLIFKNKYFILFALIFILNYIVAGLTQGAGLYFARDVMGNINYFGTMTLCGFAPMFVCAFFLPMLISKIGKWKICMIGFVIEIIGFGIIGLFADSFSAVCIGLVIKGIGSFPMTTLMYALLADIIDYGEYKDGVRLDGMTSSCVTFGTKVGTGFGSAILGWGLVIGGYQGGAAVQSVSALSAIKAIYAYVPIIFIVVAMILYYFVNLDKIAPEVQAKLAENRVEIE